MKQKQLMVVAVACGLICSACIVLFMVSVQGEANAARAEALARYGGEQVDVCVATRDIAAGERVDLSAIETRSWIADLLPEGAVREASEVTGKTASSAILKGEVISTSRFESSHSDFEIPQGKEAVSVPAQSVQAVGGAIRPGMSVDVYASGDTSTTALIRDVLVLDSTVGGGGAFSSGDSGCITLAVPPDRIEEIIAASNKTNLYFVLPSDNGGAESANAAKAEKKAKKDAGSSDAGANAQAPETSGSGSAQSAETAGGSGSAQSAEGGESQSSENEGASEGADESGEDEQ